jgi:pimeloyl-ACP methyl ester carboxylesterase
MVFKEGKDVFLERMHDKITSGTLPTLLVGWSLGGMLALELITKSVQIQKNCILVIISSSSNFTNNDLRRIRSLNKLASHISQVIENPSVTALKNFYQDLVLEYELFDVSGPELIHLLHNTKHLSFSGLLEALRYLEHSDLSVIAKLIQTPSVIIHGHNDMVIPCTHSEKLHALIPESRLVILPDSGHMIPFTHSDIIANIIRDIQK